MGSLQVGLTRIETPGPIIPFQKPGVEELSRSAVVESCSGSLEVVYCLRLHESNSRLKSLSDQREIAMSDASSLGPAKTTAKPFWPTRNIIGLIILAGVTAVGVIEYTAYFGHKWAVAALNSRAADEDKELMTITEAEKLLGKESDGPASGFTEGVWNFDQKTYTWSGLLKKHTVTAYYTKG